MSIRQFGIITMVVALLIWPAGVYQVRAVSPEPALPPTPTTQPSADEPGFDQEISNHLFLSSPTLPGVVLIQNAAPAITNGSIQLMATSGHWTGTTNQGRPMSFDVLSSGNQWDNFQVQATFSNCNVLLTYTLFGPGPINNNRFSGVSTDGVFSFSGQFNSANTASGTYNFSNISIPGCGNRSQSGTWTASIHITQCEDTFEPDNNFSSAKSISVNGTAQAHNFHVSGDEDWVKFTRTAGKVYTMTTSNLGASNDTYIYLYDTNGTTILAQDDDSGPGLGSQIVWPATGNGTYYVRVRHFNNSGGCTGYNYNLAVTEGTARLVAPIPLTAVSSSQTQILLSWPDPNTIESGYKIERSPNGTSGWVQIATVGANVTTYLNSGLTCGTTYYYRIRAYNASGDSAYSNTANATPPCPPLAPSNLTATAVSTNRINLAWQDNSNNETGFKIERSANAPTSWTQIATVGANITTYSDIGLTPGTSYFYQVRAYNAAGNSARSNQVSATTFPGDGNPVTSTLYLPLIMKNFAPPPPPPPGSKPVDGHWTGTTSRSQPMSFDVSSGGISLSNFKLKTGFQVGPCSGTLETTVSNPRPISNNQFSSNSGNFTFSGQFNTPTSASGTYAYVNHFIPGCGTFNQSGTWTANAP